MPQKKKILVLFIAVCVLFILLTGFCMSVLSKSELDRKANSLTFEDKIHYEYSRLSPDYRIKRLKTDNITEIFVRNLKNRKKKTANFEEIWETVRAGVSKTQLFSIGDPILGHALDALQNAKIIKADLDTRGTQLKLLLTLEGNQNVVFKPKWYEKGKIIEGPVYAGKDRFGSEILAFYLSAILNKPLVPISTYRTINVKKEIIPVATERLLATKYLYKNRTCIYGKCFYCKREDPICDDNDGLIIGAMIFNLEQTIDVHRSPWQRTYKKSKQASWETNDNYCRLVQEKISKHRIYDLVDTAVFDFLIQNGDRHHYETIGDNVIYIDNGKGLGNPFIHHIDILAPLYQCCVIRSSTWKRLLDLSGGTLKENLYNMPDVDKFVDGSHIEAINERLLFIFATVEFCKSRNKGDKS